MILRTSLLFFCCAVLAGCAHDRAATFRFIDAQTGFPAPEVEVTKLGIMYQPHIPLCYPVPYWFPIPDGEVYSDEHGEVSFDSVSNKARFRINKDGYKGIYVKTTGPAMKMRYLPGDEVVTRQYDDGTVTILLQRD